LRWIWQLTSQTIKLTVFVCVLFKQEFNFKSIARQRA
jgi:hypothetical protein